MAGSRRDIREAEKLAPLVPSHRVDDAPTDSDRLAVTHLLGREPQGAYRVVVRNSRTGWPVVIRNEPLLADGTPMPTRYWLVGEPERTMVSRLESRGGVNRAERDAALPPDWTGPRPSAGVGGTRVGVKCLHAHFGWYLAGGDDPVGAWVAERLAAGEGDPHPTAAG